MSLGSDFRADNAFELEHGLPTSIDRPFIKASNARNKTRGVYQCGDYLVIADNWRDAQRRLGSDKYAFKTTRRIVLDENGIEGIQ